MNIKNLDLLCDPKTHKSLKYTGTTLEIEDGKKYQIQHNIPVLMDQADIDGLNLKYQRFYDKIAKVFN
jgi:uncharacterized protein YbaR (Trm112 family)